MANKKDINLNVKFPGAKKKKVKEDKCCSVNKDYRGPGMYCLGVIGAAIYYISTATGFWMGVLGVLKALVWPAFLVYELLMFLGV
jgi:hypothetical protein